MKLEAFHDGLLADARTKTRGDIEAARQKAAGQLKEARRQAKELVEKAEQEGREAAERATARQRAEARDQAREQVLTARRATLQQLRERALSRLREREDDPAYGELMSRLEAMARSQLGEETTIERDPEAGGLVGRSGDRLVDYRLPTLVDRAMEAMGSELEDLWK